MHPNPTVPATGAVERNLNLIETLKAMDPSLLKCKRPEGYLLPPEAQNDAGVRLNLICQIEAVHLLHSGYGVRVIEVDAPQADLYAQTDLSGITPAAWMQPYPLIFVNTGQEVVRVFPLDLPGYGKFVCLSRGFRAGGLFGNDNVIAQHDMERAFVHMYANSPSFPFLRAGRIAANAVLHYTNYGQSYGAFPNRSAAVKYPRQRDGKRVTLIPQVIRIKVTHTGPTDTQAGHHNSAGTGKSPHWRKGHWRKQAVGIGRNERRLTWIKPILIRRDVVEGATDVGGTILIR